VSLQNVLLTVDCGFLVGVIRTLAIYTCGNVKICCV